MGDGEGFGPAIVLRLPVMVAFLECDGGDGVESVSWCSLSASDGLTIDVGLLLPDGGQGVGSVLSSSAAVPPTVRSTLVDAIGSRGADAVVPSGCTLGISPGGLSETDGISCAVYEIVPVWPSFWKSSTAPVILSVLPGAQSAVTMGSGIVPSKVDCVSRAWTMTGGSSRYYQC